MSQFKERLDKFQYLKNSSDKYEHSNCSENCSFSDKLGPEDPNYVFLLLLILPAACIFGNVLVVTAVLTERTLKTSTNYLLVSLAAADLLVGSLVMPFSVYLTVNNLRWYLPPVMCNFFCVVDVSASTASIVNLVAISIDRFFAVVKQFEYKTAKHQRRVYGTIALAWTFSISLGLPLGIGLNQGRAESESGSYECGIMNTYFMFYCSIMAFFVPCIVMIIMYSFVFYRLHERLRGVRLQEMAASHMVQMGDNIGNILRNAYEAKSAPVRENTMMWAMPFLRNIEATIEEDDSISTDEIDELTTILQTLESDNRIYKLPEANGDPLARGKRTPRRTPSRASNRYGALEDEINEEENDNPFSPASVKRKQRPVNRMRRFYLDVRKHLARGRSIYRAKTKIVGLKSRALKLMMKLKNKQGMAIRKETRATKLVAIVLVVFLCCWTPFFTMNLYKVFSIWGDTWDPNLEKVFLVFSWLGYLNSCLNPFIYSAINRKFRAAFRKILRCPGKVRGKKTIRAGQPNRGLTTATGRSHHHLPITSSVTQSGPSFNNSRLRIPQPGSTDQGYASTSTEGTGVRSRNLKMHGFSSPRLISKRLIRSPSPISEHDTLSRFSMSGDQATIFLEDAHNCDGLARDERVDEVCRLKAEPLDAESACAFKDGVETDDLTEAREGSSIFGNQDAELELLSNTEFQKNNCINFDDLSLRNIDSDYLTENTSVKKDSISAHNYGKVGSSQETENNLAVLMPVGTHVEELGTIEKDNEILQELEPMLPVRTRAYSGILRDEDTLL